MEIKDFIENSTELYNGEPWFGVSIVGSLHDITLESWNLKPENTSNSIATIVCHMIDLEAFCN